MDSATHGFEVHAAGKVLANASPEDVICAAFDGFPGQLAVSTSLSVDDMVLLDLCHKVRAGRELYVFTLDTGRLHQETYDVLERAQNRFDHPIHVVVPDAQAVSELVTLKGPNSFYRSTDDRKECCAIRKVTPLRNTLANVGAWMTGLRASHGVTRLRLSPVEIDVANSGAPRDPARGPLIKFNPLFSMTDDEVWAYAREHDLPTNVLHAQGFPSIGCAPCTRAIAAGEDPRAGRWWWEAPETKECGLHAAP